MARTTLIGDYGNFVKVTLGAEVTTGDLSADTWYLVTAVASTSSGLPVAAEAGYLIYSSEETLGSGDKVKALTLTNLCDIQSWGLDFNKDEIEVTALCDEQKKYLAGKSDITGSSTGVFKIGTTDADGGIQNAFVDIVSASGSYAINKIDDGTLYVLLETQKSTTAGETQQFYFAPITLTSFSQGASLGEGQTFDSAFRIAPDETNNVKFAYYSYTHSA